LLQVCDSEQLEQGITMRRRLSSPEEFEARYFLHGAPVDDISVEAGNEIVYPEFSLPDVNETSPTFGQNVSPSDYLGEVSAWYFGHAS
jgi:hypothetical protein